MKTENPRVTKKIQVGLLLPFFVAGSVPKTYVIQGRMQDFD
jgi:hypothetical protein